MFIRIYFVNFVELCEVFYGKLIKIHELQRNFSLTTFISMFQLFSIIL